LKDFAALQADNLAKVRAELKALRACVTQETQGVPKLNNWGKRAVENLEARANALKNALAGAKMSVLDANCQIASLRVEMERLEPMARFRKEFETVRPRVQSSAKVRNDIAVGFASSMEKVLPRGGVAITPRVTNAVEVALARNEKESFQLLVLPCERDLSRVRITSAICAPTAARCFRPPISTPFRSDTFKQKQLPPLARRMWDGGRIRSSISKPPLTLPKTICNPSGSACGRPDSRRRAFTGARWS
jgi:hypothetical protein